MIVSNFFIIKIQIMKNPIKNLVHFSMALMTSWFVLSSCQKEFTGNITGPIVGNTSTRVPAFTAIPVALNASTDSVYVVNDYDRELLRESIPLSALPMISQDYLTEVYENHQPLMAYTVFDQEGNMYGYISIIRFHNRPVALEFGGDGVFNKVMEQREWQDIDGEGWHPGGIFDDRDGAGRDVIDLTNLPDEIKTHLSNYYFDNTLLKAFKTKEESYIVISKNNGAYATLFGSNNQFENHFGLPAVNCEMDDIAKSGLSSSVLNYLSYTFPNYVFNKADVVHSNGNMLGNLVLINANNTRYAIAFDPFGNFMSNKVVY
jgi:hypothetical protein